MVISKRENPKCELEFEDDNIKQMKNFKYMGRVLTEDKNVSLSFEHTLG